MVDSLVWCSRSRETRAQELLRYHYLRPGETCGKNWPVSLTQGVVLGFLALPVVLFLLFILAFYN